MGVPYRGKLRQQRVSTTTVLLPSGRLKAKYVHRQLSYKDIGVTLNTYTHLGLEDAAEELRRMEEAESARREQEKLAGKSKDSQKLFNAV